ncbi:MAG TPA: flagellin [Terriglobia bacterium]|nr:flagellin [Terriglobia bacterium]
MALSVLTNIPSIAAQNALAATNAGLQKTLFRMSSGSRINSGADDAAGLAIADGLKASITALTQSARNANDGVGSLQVADGALAQVTNLLNRAITLATEAATGTVGDTQRTALDAEFTAIKAEIDRIGSNTTFNGASVFSATTTSIFLGDASSSSEITVTTGALSSSAIGTGTAVDLSDDDLTSAANASTALGEINDAIAAVAAMRGDLGATINRLQAAASVIQNQVQNLTAAEDGIRAADMAAEVAALTKYSVLTQTGMAAIAQANAHQQSVLALLR